jgi:16S rRNA (guanine527-N7)-methyltransferase
MPQEFLKSTHVSRETILELEKYLALLVKWQNAINLVSPKTISEAWNRHFVDSAQLLPLIPDHINTIADLGTGAGFPGHVLSILNPNFDVHLVESDDKKCQFLKAVSRETISKATVHHCRIEDSIDKIVPDLVTARALASLDKLLDYSVAWLRVNSNLHFIFLKGERAEEEIAEARKKYDFKVDLYPSETDPNARIVDLCDVHVL